MKFRELQFTVPYRLVKRFYKGKGCVPGSIDACGFCKGLGFAFGSKAFMLILPVPLQSFFSCFREDLRP